MTNTLGGYAYRFTGPDLNARGGKARRYLRIPTKRATDSERRRPSIPIDGGQGFR
jgi:hypothetical protein